MKIKTTLAAALLALSPSIALAMGCSEGGHEQVTMSCADGTVFDSEKGVCVPLVTG